MRRDDGPDDFDGPVPSLDIDGPTPNEAANTCGFPELTKELWNSGVNEEVAAWATKQAVNYEKWLQQRLDQGHTDFYPFHWYLSKTWTPRLADDISKCNGGRFCSIVSCEFIRTDWGKDNARLASYAFQKFSNFWESHAFIKEDFEEATKDLEMKTFEFVKQFTDADKLVASLAQQKLREALMFHTIGLILMSLQPQLPLGGPLAPLKDFTGSMVGFYMGMTAIWQDNERFSQNPHFTLTGETQALARAMNVHISDAIQNQTFAIVNHPKPYIQILQSDQFVERKVRDTTMREKIKKQLGRLTINHLWNSATVYIVQAESSDCESDKRVPAQTKVCLKEDPNHVYEALFLGVEKEGDTCGRKAEYLRGPPGYQLLGTGEYSDLSLEDVVRDSLKYYTMNGLDLKAMDAKTFEEMSKRVHEGVDPRDLFPTFTVPILSSPRGQALSSISSKKGRNYPVMSGDCEWSGHGHGHHLVSDACNDEHQKFLQRTGLFASEDYMMMTEKHNVKWNKDKPIEFDTEFPDAGKVKYAVKYVRDYAEEHSYLGHEDPGDDGTIDHKDEKWGQCSKDHSHVHKNEAHPPCIPHE